MSAVGLTQARSPATSLCAPISVKDAGYNDRFLGGKFNTGGFFSKKIHMIQIEKKSRPFAPDKKVVFLVL